jgi:hypothetical protein
MTYQWHEFYSAAVLETDWSKMEERVQAAESALRERRAELSRDHAVTPEERQAIDDALASLNVLRQDAASWPHRAEGAA